MKKKLNLLMGAITIVALFAAGEVLAGDCGANVLPGINVDYDGMERQDDGTYLVRYILSGQKINDLTSVDIALAKNINVVMPLLPSGYSLSEPGEGSQVGDSNWGEDFWEQIILTGTPQEVGDSKLLYFYVTNGGETTGGINLNATRGRTRTCTTTVPSGSSFAQQAVIAFKKVITQDGAEICLQADPVTQCEKAVNCISGDPIPGIPVQEAIRIGDNPVTYVAVPGEPCQTFTADDGIPGATRYYCSGGYCYPY